MHLEAFTGIKCRNLIVRVSIKFDKEIVGVEGEKEEWRSFRKALDKEDRKVFDEMFDNSILYNSATGLYSCKE